MKSLIESKSIVLNAIRNRQYLLLPKENQHNEETGINEEFYNFKNIFLEKSINSKRPFFHAVKTFKEDILKLLKTTYENTDNQEQIITFIHNDITFL